MLLGDSLDYKARSSLPACPRALSLSTQLWLGTEKSPGHLWVTHYLLRNPSAKTLQCLKGAGRVSISKGRRAAAQKPHFHQQLKSAVLGCSPKVQEIPTPFQNRQSKTQTALAQHSSGELLLAPALMWHNAQWQALNSRIAPVFLCSITLFCISKR